MTSIHSAADGSRALIAEKKAVREDRRHEWSRLHRIGAGQTSLGHTDHEVLVVDKCDLCRQSRLVGFGAGPSALPLHP